jgi:hypothetical protein
MCWLALQAHGPGQRGGVGAALALLGSCWGWAADALICTACLRSSAKMGGAVALALLGLVCLAQFAQLSLLCLRCCQAAAGSACAARSQPMVKVEGG